MNTRAGWAGIFAAVLALCVGGCGRSSDGLRSRLDAASSPDEIATVAKLLLREGGERGREVVEEYAAREPGAAFDAELATLLLFDPADGGVWIEQVGERDFDINTGDPELDEAIERVLPESRSKLLLEIPAERLRGIERVDDPAGHLFVLREETATRFFGLLLRPDGPTSLYEVDPVTLTRIPLRRDE